MYIRRTGVKPLNSPMVSKTHQALTALFTTALFSTGALAGEPQDLYDDTVYRTMELVFDDSDWNQQLRNNWQINDATDEDIYVVADLIVYDSPTDMTGTTYPDVGVQYKGNSSYWFVDGLKKPYKITMDAFIEDQELYGHSKITLNNGIFDPTKIREVIAYKILREFMPAPEANLVFVRSGTAGNVQDIGVYTSVERVNKKFMDKHFNNDNGHRYKADSGSMLYRGENVSQYSSDYDVSGGNESTEYLDLIDVCDSLNNTPINDLRADLDELFSIDRLTWQAAAGVALMNWDDLRAFAPNGHNYYIYEDTLNERLHILPWDWDLAFSTNTNDGVFEDFNNSNIPLTDRLILDVPEIEDRYLAHLRDMSERIDWNEIQTDVIRHRAFTDSIISTVHETEIFSISQYNSSHQLLSSQIPNRRQFLDNQSLLNRPAPMISDVEMSPESPTSNDIVWVNATIVEQSTEGISGVVLYSRDQGRYMPTPMLDDGNHNDGAANDGVYGASIQAWGAGTRVEYYIEASSADTTGGSTGAKRYEPLFAEHQPMGYQVRASSFDSPIVINEFMADNDTTIQDPDGTGFPDWIELHNTSDSTVDLSGYFLTDDLSDTTQFEIPNGVSIEAGGFLIFWADNDPEQGPTHTNFKLGSGGEEIGLFAPTNLDNGVADSYVFGAQESDISEGRSCDGDSSWTFFNAPTPGTSNGSCSLPCLADFTNDGQLDFFDISAFLIAFSDEQAEADFNNDGNFNFFDVSTFLSLFSAGCP
ncbi:MAG: CotH kinase family protein [Phycisphaerales bacterium]|nr:CotH kinase family protein [Phycisphaerales bacterium]